MQAIRTTPRRSPWPWIVGAAALMGALMLSACSTPRTPEGVQPVTGFDVDRYTGKWHEVARIENSFERGLTQATATYSRNADNTIKVVNRGYDPVRKQWKEAEGLAEFVDSADRAALKVSFFGPFYGGYHVVALDPDYRWALVVGEDRSYAWILARDTHLPADTLDAIVQRAKALGIDTSAFIWVSHTHTAPASQP